MYSYQFDRENGIIVPNIWRGARAAEGARLESGCASKRRTEGSNPSLSAKLMAIAVPARR